MSIASMAGAPTPERILAALNEALLEQIRADYRALVANVSGGETEQAAAAKFSRAIAIAFATYAGAQAALDAQLAS